MATATATVKTIRRDVPFTWDGMDRKGNRVKGRSLAPDEAALRADLRRQGIAPSRIRKQASPRGISDAARPTHAAGGRLNLLGDCGHCVAGVRAREFTISSSS